MASFQDSFYFSLLILEEYEQNHHSGFLSLPHQTTLKEYTEFITIETRFNLDIIKILRDNNSFEQLKACEKYLSLFFNDIKIKSGLVFSKSSGKLAGFTELGGASKDFMKVFKDLTLKAFKVLIHISIVFNG